MTPFDSDRGGVLFNLPEIEPPLDYHVTEELWECRAGRTNSALKHYEMLPREPYNRGRFTGKEGFPWFFKKQKQKPVRPAILMFKSSLGETSLVLLSSISYQPNVRWAPPFTESALYYLGGPKTQEK